MAVAAVFASYTKANEDGKVSFAEGVKIAIGNAGKVTAGLMGLGQIDDELKAADTEALDAMINEVMPELNGIITDDVRLAVQQAYQGLRALKEFASTVYRIRHPRAEILPE